MYRLGFFNPHIQNEIRFIQNLDSQEHASLAHSKPKPNFNINVELQYLNDTNQKHNFKPKYSYSTYK